MEARLVKFSRGLQSAAEVLLLAANRNTISLALVLHEYFHSVFDGRGRRPCLQRGPSPRALRHSWRPAYRAMPQRLISMANPGTIVWDTRPAARMRGGIFTVCRGQRRG